jgi:hypothetical protein
MRRREFLSVLGSTAAVWPVVARAQPGHRPTIGFLGGLHGFGSKPMDGRARPAVTRTRLERTSDMAGVCNWFAQ